MKTLLTLFIALSSFYLIGQEQDRGCPGSVSSFSISTLDSSYYSCEITTSPYSPNYATCLSSLEDTITVEVTDTSLASIFWGFQDRDAQNYFTHATWRRNDVPISSELYEFEIDSIGSSGNCYSPTGNVCRFKTNDEGVYRFQPENGLQSPYIRIVRKADENQMDTSIQTISNLDINVYPNPTSDFLIIQFDQMQSGSIHLFSVQGKLVSKSEIDEINLINRIDLSSFSKGTYVLSIRTNSGIMERKKIIVE